MLGLLIGILANVWALKFSEYRTITAGKLTLYNFRTGLFPKWITCNNYIKLNMGLINKVDMVCLSLLRRRANARNVS